MKTSWITQIGTTIGHFTFFRNISDHDSTLTLSNISGYLTSTSLATISASIILNPASFNRRDRVRKKYRIIYVKEAGFNIIDADIVAREVLVKYPEILERVKVE